jgi:SAM-dependent methyltransferase
LWLASLGIDVVCSDLEDPQPRAAPHHQRFAVPGQIRYEAFSATDIPYREQFDVVVLKSVLGAIARPDDLEPRREALRQCHLALRPGGVLLFAENLRGSAMHRFLRRHFVAWGRRWAYLDVREIPAEFAHFAELHCATFGFLGALGRSESQRRILGRLDRFLVPLLPPSQHYLVYGVARR